jgi:hypothetical protein
MQEIPRFRFTILRLRRILDAGLSFKPGAGPMKRVSGKPERLCGGAAAIDMDWPVFSGGKKFNQIGIVVGDERAAKRTRSFRNWGWGIPLVLPAWPVLP